MYLQLTRLRALYLSILISTAECLPKVQILPTIERPFVLMHLVGCTAFSREDQSNLLFACYPYHYAQPVALANSTYFLGGLP